MMKIQVMPKITSHVKHVVLELSEYTPMARTLAWPVLAKLCSTALSVESSICLSHDSKDELQNQKKLTTTINQLPRK